MKMGGVKEKMEDRLHGMRSAMAVQTPGVMLVLALVFGVVAGVVAFVYSKWFEFLLWVVWEILPQKVVQPLLTRGYDKHDWFPAVGQVAWIYTILIAVIFGGLAGITQRILGSPGDLPDTIKCIHERGSIPAKQVPSMFVCSAFSITAGASLGPEAALLSLCGATISYVARKVFNYRHRELRNCAIMGMTAALAAFFGVALGGSFFALEVLHRQGLQFFEIAVYGITSGTICLVVFRALSVMAFGQVWHFPISFPVVDARHVLVGALIGMLSAAIVVMFMQLHKTLGRIYLAIGLHEHHTPIRCGLLGGLLVGVIGVFIPPTMFWGEYEIQTLADPSQKPLPHIWPSGGFYGLEPFREGHYNAGWYALIAIFKLVAISISVLSGFRGGFIFPLFLVGTSLGYMVTGFHIPWISDLPPVLLAMSFAAGLNVAITRTPIATPLILAILSGSPQVTVPCVAAAIASLFITLKLPFIKTQRDRDDFHFKEVHLPEEDVEIIEALLNNVTGEGHTPRSIEEARLAYFRDRDSSLATDEMLQHEGELPAVGGV